MSARARLSPALQQTALLFSIDMLTNVTDYGFHIYLGRVLAAGEFAAVQTVNSLVLILVTTFSVLQPTIARYTAAHATPQTHGYFQQFMRLSTVVGSVLAALFILLRQPLGDWLHVPPATIIFLGGLVIVACVRPVLAGMLQGQQRFLPFGLVRTSFAFGRFLFAILLITIFGRNATSAIAAYPLGGLISLLVAGLFLGRSVWQKQPASATADVKDGLRLSLAALLAYAAYMSLQNIDLIWVNRAFSAELAGSYATAVVLRRILAVLPLTVTVILYPKIVALVESGKHPDRLLARAAALIVLPTVALTAVYIVAGDWLVSFIFGAGYAEAGALLGWFGFAMIGFGLASVWLNLFLATKPTGFVALLLTLAAGQLLLLTLIQPASLTQVAQLFALGGWTCTVGGAVLYFGLIRPKI